MEFTGSLETFTPTLAGPTDDRTDWQGATADPTEGPESTDTRSESYPIPGESDHVVIEIVVYAAGFTGLFTNLFVLAVLLTSARLRTATTFVLLIHQAVADLYVSITLLISYIVWFNGDGIKVADGILGQIHCRLIINEAILTVGYNVSTLNVAMMAIERLMLAVFPQQHKSPATKKILHIMIALLWVLALIFVFPITTAMSVQQNNCQVGYAFNSASFTFALGSLVMVIYFFLPMSLIISSYTFIVVKLWKRGKQIKRNQVQSLSNPSATVSTVQANWQKLSKTQVNILKVTATIGAVFIITWMPNKVYILLYTTGHPLTFQDAYYSASVCLAVINFTINPFIYIFRCAEFEKRVRKIFGLNNSITPGN